MVGRPKLQTQTHRIRRAGCLAILALLAAFSAAAEVDAKADSSPANRQSGLNRRRRKDLPNFGKATPTLFHGGQPSKEGFRILAGMGVNIVVDLRGSRDRERKIV